MAKANWSRPLPRTVTPLDGQPLRTLRDIYTYMEGISERRLRGRAWQHLMTLLLAAAERDGDREAVASQLELALMLDGRLDVRPAPGG